MTKRLIAFTLMLVLIVSLATCAFALDKDGTVITPIPRGGSETGGYMEGYRVGSGGRFPGPCSICSYSCLN